MTTNMSAWNHRGPMPPWPAKVDLVTWLLMSSEARAEHCRRHAEKEGSSEADTDRMIRYWDHNAALLKMARPERAEQIRRNMEQAWAGHPDEIERQTECWIKAWDEIAAPGEHAP